MRALEAGVAICEEDALREEDVLAVRLTVIQGGRALTRVATMISGRNFDIMSLQYERDEEFASCYVTVSGSKGLFENLLWRVAQLIDVVGVEVVGDGVWSGVRLDPTTAGQTVEE